MAAHEPRGASELLDQLDQARAAATPGPWQVESGDVWTVPEFDLHRFDVMGEQVAKTDLVDADASLIVAAVNHLPQLTAALRAVLALADERDRNGVDIDPDDVITAVEQALTTHTNQEGATK